MPAINSDFRRVHLVDSTGAATGVTGNALVTSGGGGGGSTQVEGTTAHGAAGTSINPVLISHLNNDNAQNQRWTSFNIADAKANAGSLPWVGSVGELFNGTNFDRERNNQEGSLLVSAARTATTASADQTNHNSRGVKIYLNVTANPGGAQTLNLQVQEKDPVSGTYVTLADSDPVSVFGAAGGSTGLEVVEVYPGAVETITNGYSAQGLALPRTWRVNVVHSAAGSWTYSVGFALTV